MDIYGGSSIDTEPFQVNINGTVYSFRGGEIYKAGVLVTNQAEKDAFQRYMDTNYPQPEGVYNAADGMYHFAAWRPPGAVRTTNTAAPILGGLSSETLIIGAGLILLLLLMKR